MPRITVEWLAGRTVEQRAAVARALTQAISEAGGVSQAMVTVVFNEHEPTHQAKGGVLHSEKAKTPA